jgi:di/tricarboxylate transporter
METHPHTLHGSSLDLRLLGLSEADVLALTSRRRRESASTSPRRYSDSSLYMPLHGEPHPDHAVSIEPPLLAPPSSDSILSSTETNHHHHHQELRASTTSSNGIKEYDTSHDANANGNGNGNGNGSGKPPEDPFPRPRRKKPTIMSMYKEAGIWETLKWWLVKFLKNNWGILLFLFINGLILMFLGIFAFEPLSWKAWMAFAITLIMLAFLIKGHIATQIVVLAAMTAMLAFFIATPVQALVGFSNTGVLTVGAMFAFAEGIERTSLLRPIFRFLLGNPKKLWIALLRLLVPVAVFSSFFPNTPIVAMLVPVVLKWSRQAGFPASKLLMPMNNATILGGTISLLGTSTNLIVAGLAEQAGLKDKNGNLMTFPIFGMAPVGIPICVVGIIYLLIAANILIKERKPVGAEDLVKNPRQYTVALTVLERSPIIGDTIQEAGLRNLEGLFLVELTRSDGTSIPAPSHDVVVQAGDILLFAGVVETVTELYFIPGLVPATGGQSDKIEIERHRRRLVEVVISRSSDMVGYSVKDCRFRTRFGAAIIAIHRHGEHVTEKIGDIVLHAGDVLLIECGEDFVEHFGKNHTFALVSEVNNSTPPREDVPHMLISAAAVVILVAITTAELMSILTVTLLCIFGMSFLGCMTLGQAGAAVSLPVLLTIACSFGVSAGMQYSGAAGALAGFIVDVFSFAEIGLLFGIYIGTALLSAVITNNAAVVLMFSVLAGDDGILATGKVDPYAALYTMMYAGSSSFSTPIGYQTNLMVHAPGGYTFMDWVKFGVPLNILSGIVAVVLSYFIYT